MTAYVIFIREKLVDADEMAAYTDMAMKSVDGHPINILTAYAPHEVWEGEGCDALLILSFPDGHAAKAWYNSEAYQEAKAHRLRGGNYRVIFTEG